MMRALDLWEERLGRVEWLFPLRGRWLRYGLLGLSAVALLRGLLTMPRALLPFVLAAALAVWLAASISVSFCREVGQDVLGIPARWRRIYYRCAFCGLMTLCGVFLAVMLFFPCLILIAVLLTPFLPPR